MAIPLSDNVSRPIQSLSKGRAIQSKATSAKTAATRFSAWDIDPKSRGLQRSLDLRAPEDLPAV